MISSSIFFFISLHILLFSSQFIIPTTSSSSYFPSSTSFETTPTLKEEREGINHQESYRFPHSFHQENVPQQKLFIKQSFTPASISQISKYTNEHHLVQSDSSLTHTANQREFIEKNQFMNNKKVGTNLDLHERSFTPSSLLSHHRSRKAVDHVDPPLQQLNTNEIPIFINKKGDEKPQKSESDVASLENFPVAALASIAAMKHEEKVENGPSSFSFSSDLAENNDYKPDDMVIYNEERETLSSETNLTNLHHGELENDQDSSATEIDPLVTESQYLSPTSAVHTNSDHIPPSDPMESIILKPKQNSIVHLAPPKLKVGSSMKISKNRLIGHTGRNAVTEGIDHNVSENANNFENIQDEFDSNNNDIINSDDGSFSNLPSATSPYGSSSISPKALSTKWIIAGSVTPVVLAALIIAGFVVAKKKKLEKQSHLQKQQDEQENPAHLETRLSEFSDNYTIPSIYYEQQRDVISPMQVAFHPGSNSTQHTYFTALTRFSTSSSASAWSQDAFNRS